MTLFLREWQACRIRDLYTKDITITMLNPLLLGHLQKKISALPYKCLTIASFDLSESYLFIPRLINLNCTILPEHYLPTPCNYGARLCIFEEIVVLSEGLLLKRLLTWQKRIQCMGQTAAPFRCGLEDYAALCIKEQDANSLLRKSVAYQEVKAAISDRGCKSVMSRSQIKPCTLGVMSMQARKTISTVRDQSIAGNDIVLRQ